MARSRRGWLLLLVLLLCPRAEAGRTVVIWISVDGLRGDYVDKAPPDQLPLLRRLMREGASTRRLVPVFPSLTFPTHTSQATGLPVAVHGITGNEFHDAGTGKSYRYPDDWSLLEAEPIWLTAARQGVGVAVYWPLSYAQNGKVQTRFFAQNYEPQLTDEQRLEKLLDAWRTDGDRDNPLRLLMGYMGGPDSEGHMFGPDSTRVADAVADADRQLRHFLEQALALFARRQTVPEDELYLLISADHGMAAVKTCVNFSRLLTFRPPRGLRFVPNGPLGQVFFDGLEEPQRGEVMAQTLRDLRRHPFLSVHRRPDLPREWNYAHATRTGDLVILLKPGHTFNSRLPAATFDPREAGTALGMHGWAAADVPEMMGLAIFWRHGRPLGGRDLGEVDSLRLHPTVAKLLNIRPSEKATAPAVELEGKR